MTVAPQGAPVRRGRWLPVGPVGGDYLDPYRGQLRVSRITGVSFSPDELRRPHYGNGVSTRIWDQGDCMRRRSGRVDGERKTRAVCHRDELRPLAPLGRSHSRSPLLATTTVASMTHALRSSAPRSRRSAARPRGCFAVYRRAPTAGSAWGRCGRAGSARVRLASGRHGGGSRGSR